MTLSSESVLAVKLGVLVTSHLLSLAAGMQIAGTSRAAPAIDPATCLEAVIVEPRKLQNIATALESAVLAKTARFDRFTIVHGSGNGEYVQQLVENSTVLRNQYDLGTVSFREIEVKDLGGDAQLLAVPGPLCDTTNASSTSGASHLMQVQHHDQYSRILKSPEFWRDAQCDQMLLMQSDTVLCSNSQVQLSEFMQYEYVGGHSPRLDRWYPGERMHMNGGLSFRNRKGMLRCISGIASFSPAMQTCLNNLPEDSFFSNCEELKQPPAELLEGFAVDGAAFKIGPDFAPFAVHKPWGGRYDEFIQSNLQHCEGAMELYKHKDMKP